MALSKVNPNFVNVSQVGGRRNLVINGAMQVAQRGTSFTGVGNGAGTYPVDRWQYNQLADSAFTVEQVSDAPADFSNSAKFTVTTPDTSITSTQYSQCVHKIEGQNINHLNWGSSDAKTVTFSCWVKSSVTGQYPARFINSAGTKSYAFYITINSANTWEYKTHTLVGPTDGTFLTNNGEGVAISLGFAVGSDYTGATANQWQTVSGYLASNLTNTTGFIATTNATFQITGVQLEVGDTDTPFEHRSFGEELSLCQRYFFNPLFGRTTGSIYYPIHFNQVSTGNNGLLRWQVTFPVSMRTSPSFTHSLTDAKFQTSAPNGTDNWAFYRQNSGWSSKAGNSDISVLNIAPSVNQANVGAYYVTPNDTLATAIGIGGGATFNFSAEL